MRVLVWERCNGRACLLEQCQRQLQPGPSGLQEELPPVHVVLCGFGCSRLCGPPKLLPGEFPTLHEPREHGGPCWTGSL